MGDGTTRRKATRARPPARGCQRQATPQRSLEFRSGPHAPAAGVCMANRKEAGISEFLSRYASSPSLLAEMGEPSFSFAPFSWYFAESAVGLTLQCQCPTCPGTTTPQCSDPIEIRSDGRGGGGGGGSGSGTPEKCCGRRPQIRISTVARQLTTIFLTWVTEDA